MKLPVNNFNLGDATRNVLILKQDISKGIIALGQWISLVKESLPYTEYLNWLKYDVKIHRTTAWRYMKVAQEIDYPTLEKLGPSKVYEILELPDSEFKEELIKKADSMTVQDIRKEVAVATSQPDIIEAVSPDVADINVALDANATLLDALFRIDSLNLAKNVQELLVNQLKQTPLKINKFLEGIYAKG